MVPTNGEPLSAPSKAPYSSPSITNKFRDSPYGTPENLVASSPILGETNYSDNSSVRYFGRTSFSPTFERNQVIDAPTWKEDIIEEQSQDMADSTNGGTQGERVMDSGGNEKESNGESSSSTHRARGSIDLYKYSESSQTAEQAMDNARRKLNALEGNLKGARHSLLSPSLNSPRPPELSKYSGSTRQQSNLSAEEEERLRARGPRIRFGLPRQPQATTHSSTQRTPKGDLQNSGHSRVYSETSVPTGLGIPIKGSRVLEQGQVTLDPLQRSPRSVEKQANKSPLSTGGLSSYSSPSPSSRRVSALASYQASPSTRDLRGKAEELKGRLSFIQERVREDAVRRTSFQPSKSMSDGDENSLLDEIGTREPNILNGEELKDEFRNEKDGQSDYQPPKSEDYSTDEGPADDYSTDGSSSHKRSGSQQLKGVLKYPDSKKEIPQRQSDSRAEWHRVLSENRHDLETGSLSPTEEGSDDDNDFDFQSVLEHQLDETDELAMQGAHEDRADAFDYEHFILHSALGNYAAGRPLSSSAGSSASTTRGPAHNEFMDAEQANASTVSYDTADEGQGTDSGSEGADWDEINSSWPVPPVSSQHSRTTSDVDESHSRGVSMPQVPNIFGVNESRRPASIILAAMLASSGAEHPLEQSDGVLVRSIVEELGNICSRLSNAGLADRGEADALRNKLQQVKNLLGDELSSNSSKALVNGEAHPPLDSVESADTLDVAGDAGITGTTGAEDIEGITETAKVDDAEAGGATIAVSSS